MPTDKYDRWVIGACEGALEVQTIDIGKGYIENQAARANWISQSQIFGGGCEGDAIETFGHKQIDKRFAYPEVVIDDEDHLGLSRHLRDSAAPAR